MTAKRHIRAGGGTVGCRAAAAARCDGWNFAAIIEFDARRCNHVPWSCPPPMAPPPAGRAGRFGLPPPDTTSRQPECAVGRIPWMLSSLHNLFSPNPGRLVCSKKQQPAVFVNIYKKIKNIGWLKRHGVPGLWCIAIRRGLQGEKGLRARCEKYSVFNAL